MCRISWNSGSLNLLEPSGPHRVCYGTDLSLHLKFIYPSLILITRNIQWRFSVLHNAKLGYISRLVAHINHTTGWGIQGVSRLVDITVEGDFLGLCDQKISYKHVSDFGRLRSYGHFLIPVHALVWTASYGTSWRGDVLNLVAYRLRKLQRATRAVHNRAAACVAVGGGIFGNQL